MVKDSKKVERLLETFFTHSTVHSQPLLSIKKEIRSTYDGDYPYFELIYVANILSNILILFNNVNFVLLYWYIFNINSKRFVIV